MNDPGTTYLRFQATERLKTPLSQADPSKDLTTFQNLRQSSQHVSEQLLPDFYCEHITLAMNRERRKQVYIEYHVVFIQGVQKVRVLTKSWFQKWFYYNLAWIFWSKNPSLSEKLFEDGSSISTSFKDEKHKFTFKHLIFEYNFCLSMRP